MYIYFLCGRRGDKSICKMRLRCTKKINVNTILADRIDNDFNPYVAYLRIFLCNK